MNWRNLSDLPAFSFQQANLAVDRHPEGFTMRTIIEPPPTSQCSRCGEQLQLKGFDAANAAPGTSSATYACAYCGTEHSFVSHYDMYASRTSYDRRSCGGR